MKVHILQCSMSLYKMPVIVYCTRCEGSQMQGEIPHVTKQFPSLQKPGTWFYLVKLTIAFSFLYAEFSCPPP